MADDEVVITPQLGPQTAFLSSEADIVIYGGAAGGGKTIGLLLETLRHYENSNFISLILRRTNTQIRMPGALWDESKKIYRNLGGDPHESALKWVFPSGMVVRFAGLEYESSLAEYQGSQIPLICFDELTTFTEKMFWFMFSRNRSDSGVPGYIRATCNPDPDSFVRKLIDWWIKGKDYPEEERGYPIEERSGKIRWFVRKNDEMIWGNSKAEVTEKALKAGIKKSEIMPKTITFIPAKLDDNKILMTRDPSYKASLLALNEVDQERFLKGNWDIRPAGRNFFRRETFPIIERIPDGWVGYPMRFWDLAATTPTTDNPSPDWSRGSLLYLYPDGSIVWADLKSIQEEPGPTWDFLKDIAQSDGKSVRIGKHQDPGSAGKKEAQDFSKWLTGYMVTTQTVSKDKVVRATATSALAFHRNIKVVRGEWNDEAFKELEKFPPLKNTGHDDIVDSLSGGINMLVDDTEGFDPNAIDNFAALMQGGRPS